MATTGFKEAAGVDFTERTVWLVRHGHRADEAEVPSEGLGLPPLSAQGRNEALLLARAIPRPPDLLVASPFVRAQETIAPLRARFPDVPFETWPVQEFTMLPAAMFEGTTCEDRGARIDAYWAANDPMRNPGPGAESFVELIRRVEAFFDALRERRERFTVVVSHGYTIQAALWRLREPEAELDEGAMRRFQAFRGQTPVPTVIIFPLTLDHAGAIYIGVPWRPVGGPEGPGPRD